jgi:hypothetical protein
MKISAYRGAGDPPAPFDFERYLDLLQNSNNNFIRLWSRHVTRYNSYGIDCLVFPSRSHGYAVVQETHWMASLGST